jgi:hypothetical protein
MEENTTVTNSAAYASYKIKALRNIYIYIHTRVGIAPLRATGTSLKYLSLESESHFDHFCRRKHQ